jgi:tetratricopeptide (TPR) repeat protein
MNTIKHIIIITLALLPVCIMAQTQKAFINAAEKSMAEKNYHGALVYFNEALSFDDKDANLRYKTAEAARQYGAYDEAAKHYKYLLDTLKYDGNHEIAYRLGEVHQKMGEYESSKMYYDMYLSEYSNENPELTGRTRQSIESLKKAMELVKNPDASVKITRMGDEINSPDADFAAVDRMGNMYFSSMKFNGSSKENKYKQIAKTLVKKPGGVELIGGNIQDRDMSVANFSFNVKGDRAYYNVCNYVDGWATSCKIYMADVDADGNMSNEQMANESINAAGSSNTQPNVAMVDGVEYIYFVSDRLGGEGGRDIWRVPSNGGTASNVRQVNTTADEITPFYHSGTKTLYFSSEGREGLGGFDVYKYNDNKIAMICTTT